MIKRVYKIYAKILGSVLLPVFLFAAIPSPLVANSEQIQVTFQVKNSADNEIIFKRYGIDAEHLFLNIFKTKISQNTLSLMQSDNLIAYTQVDHKMQAAAITTTNDPYFTTDDLADSKQWYLAKTDIPEAWQYTQGSSSIIVAVVDTGIHATHIELNDGRIGEGFDITENKSILANTNSDDNGHGTAVAGVIGAIPNNQKGIAGVNWNVTIMPVKALSADGTGDTSAVGRGIVWAADHGASIINLSLGGSGFGADMTLSNAISYAYNKGVLLVSAAGNDLADHGISLDKSPVYPVCGDNGQNMVLGVAATDINDQKASFSNFGVSCLDISAPGKKIVTSAFLPSDPADNILIYGSGTSLATPIVSGIAALLKSSNPNLSNVEIRNILLKTADNIDFVNQTSCLASSCNGLLGKGRVNALKAIAPVPLPEGSLVREFSTGNIYLVLNGVKRLVSSIVFTQRGFDLNSVINEVSSQLAGYTLGPALTPSEGTLIKSPIDPQVYVIESEMKRPLTYLVFISRGYNFADIQVLTQSEIDSYTTGDWYWPPDGTMVLVKGDPTVYVMDKQVRRAVTYFVFIQRGLSFTKVINVTQDEFSHVPTPADTYWLAPLDGTLIKSDLDPGIYLIENGAKKLLSFEAFIGREFKFSNVKSLPQAELDVIAPGFPILIP